MTKVLILSYYWPPGGGPGVQRWLKFVKYLRRFGWEPVVYTPENPESPVFDPSLENDIPKNMTILKRRIREPYTLYKRFLGQKPEERIQAGFLSEQERPDRKQGLSVWIRGNLFIPDARKYWINPSVRYLIPYLKKHPFDCIISSGPPHSLHLIGMRLKKQLNIPWVADFRDPWTGIDFYEKLRLTKRSDRKHHKLEKEVIITADAVITVSQGMKKDFEKYRKEGMYVITNGYDPADIPAEETGPGSGFLITHLGSINADRNPLVFWKAIRQLIDEYDFFSKDLAIKLVGTTDVSVRKSIQDHTLDEVVEYSEPVPHNQVFKLLHQSHVLLLPVNNTPNASSILTGKLFEYLAAGRPILGIGPVNGEMAGILKETGSGAMCGFRDVETTKTKILQYHQQALSGKICMSVSGAGNYSRIHLTAKLAGLLDQLINNP